MLRKIVALSNKLQIVFILFQLNMWITKCFETWLFMSLNFM